MTMESKKATLVMEGEKVEVKMKDLTMSELQHFIFEHFLQKKKWTDDMKLEIKDNDGCDVETNANVADAFENSNVCFTLNWVQSNASSQSSNNEDILSKLKPNVVKALARKKPPKVNSSSHPVLTASVEYSGSDVICLKGPEQFLPAALQAVDPKNNGLQVAVFAPAGARLKKITKLFEEWKDKETIWSSEAKESSDDVSISNFQIAICGFKTLIKQPKLFASVKLAIFDDCPKLPGHAIINPFNRRSPSDKMKDLTKNFAFASNCQFIFILTTSKSLNGIHDYLTTRKRPILLYCPNDNGLYHTATLSTMNYEQGKRPSSKRSERKRDSQDSKKPRRHKETKDENSQPSSRKKEKKTKEDKRKEKEERKQKKKKDKETETDKDNEKGRKKRSSEAKRKVKDKIKKIKGKTRGGGHNLQVDKLTEGLKSIGLLDSCLGIFVQHRIDDDVLPFLDETSLNGIKEIALGDKVKFLQWLKQYQANLLLLQQQQQQQASKSDVKSDDTSTSSKDNVKANNDEEDEEDEEEEEDAEEEEKAAEEAEEEEDDDDGNEEDCVCCYERSANMVFIPCGHVSMCEECTKAKESDGVCPICNQPGTGYKTYRSGLA